MKRSTELKLHDTTHIASVCQREHEKAFFQAFWPVEIHTLLKVPAEIWYKNKTNYILLTWNLHMAVMLPVKTVCADFLHK